MIIIATTYRSGAFDKGHAKNFNMFSSNWSGGKLEMPWFTSLVGQVALLWMVAQSRGIAFLMNKRCHNMLPRKVIIRSWKCIENSLCPYMKIINITMHKVFEMCIFCENLHTYNSHIPTYDSWKAHNTYNCLKFVNKYNQRGYFSKWMPARVPNQA